MNRLNEHVWIGEFGDVYGADALRSVKARGVTALVNCTRQDIVFDPAEFKYIKLDLDDGYEIPTTALTKFLNFMYRMREADETVLIFCGAGISRACSITISWLMEMGQTWDEAERDVSRARPQAYPNPALKRSVLRFFKVPAPLAYPERVE